MRSAGKRKEIRTGSVAAGRRVAILGAPDYKGFEVRVKLCFGHVRKFFGGLVLCLDAGAVGRAQVLLHRVLALGVLVCLQVGLPLRLGHVAGGDRTAGLRSLDLVEVNPILDSGNQSAMVAVDLAASLFGKRIL